LGYEGGSKGGRLPFGRVAMFKILILQAQHNLSDARMEIRAFIKPTFVQAGSVT